MPNRSLLKKNTYYLRARFWIEGAEGTFLGYGRTLLLERIQEYGSISAAARSMKMSYRQAWRLVDAMNKQSKQPIVEKTTGGKGGGGAKVTVAGEQAIALFWAVDQNMQTFLADTSEKLLS